MENLVRTIPMRHSTRSYKKDLIEQSTKNELKSFLSQNTKGIINEDVTIGLVEAKPESDRVMKLDYGIIKNNHTYLLGKIQDNPQSRMNYGFVMEKAILKATSLGLASCWIGYFDSQYFEGCKIGDFGVIPSLAIIGYAANSESLTGKLMKRIVSSSKRKDWEYLFFDYQSMLPLSDNISSEYINALEMLRLAPSAGNTQPWRVLFDCNKNEFHFFKKPINTRFERDGLHDIDMGIALSHFDIAINNFEITGNWTVQESLKGFNDWQYMISWSRN